MEHLDHSREYIHFLLFLEVLALCCVYFIKASNLLHYIVAYHFWVTLCQALDK